MFERARERGRERARAIESESIESERMTAIERERETRPVKQRWRWRTVITLSKNCRRALWHLRLLQTSDTDTRLVQGLMYAERYRLHVSFRLQALAALRQLFSLAEAGSPEGEGGREGGSDGGDGERGVRRGMER